MYLADHSGGCEPESAYQGDPSLLNERQQEQETTPRKRKELGEFVFDAWGEPLKLG